MLTNDLEELEFYLKQKLFEIQSPDHAVFQMY